MTIKQVSVFLENRPGRLAEVLGLLKENEVNIYALYVSDTTQFGILRLIVDKPEAAFAALKENSMTATLTDVIGVSMQDECGALYEIIQTIKEEGVSIEYMYAFAGRQGTNPAALVIRPADMQEMIDMLQSKGFKLLSLEEI
ncbi:MAG: hypothetical protein HFI90_08775 [Clostridia bacterium]|nr:hypothetical protein [Clostridia bacterium]